MIYAITNEAILISTEKSRNKFENNYKKALKCFDSYISMMNKNIKILQSMHSIICSKKYSQKDYDIFMSKKDEYYKNIQICMDVFGYKLSNNTAVSSSYFVKDFELLFSNISKILNIADLKSGKLSKDFPNISEKIKQYDDFETETYKILEDINISGKGNKYSDIISKKCKENKDFNKIYNNFIKIHFDMYLFVDAAKSVRNILNSSKKYLESTIFDNLYIV